MKDRWEKTEVSRNGMKGNTRMAAAPRPPNKPRTSAAQTHSLGIISDMLVVGSVSFFFQVPECTGPIPRSPPGPDLRSLPCWLKSEFRGHVPPRHALLTRWQPLRGALLLPVAPGVQEGEPAHLQRGALRVPWHWHHHDGAPAPLPTASDGKCCSRRRRSRHGTESESTQA